MDTNVVIMTLIGLPASGKSTLTKSITEHYSNSYRENIKNVVNNTRANMSNVIPIAISFDEIIPLNEQQRAVELKIIDSTDKTSSENRAYFLETTEKVVQSIKEKRKMAGLEMIKMLPSEFNDIDKYLIILDDNFYYKSMRYKFYQLACQFNCGYLQLYLECELKEALKRNENRSALHMVPDHVIETMFKRFEIPSPNINSWEHNTVLQCDNLLDLKLFTESIEISFKMGLSVPKDTAQEVLEAQNQCKRNVIHQSDVLLRELVSVKIKTEKNDSVLMASDLKAFALKMNEIRKTVLCLVKVGDIKIADLYKNDALDIDRLKKVLEQEFNKQL